MTGWPEDSGTVGVLGRGRDGSIVLFSSATGRVLARVASESGGTTAAEGAETGVELAYDPVHRSAILVEEAAAGRGSVVRAYPLVDEQGPRFGAPWRWCATGRGARLVSAGRALLLFEPSPAPRFRLVDDEGVTQASVLSPEPSSLWARAGDGPWWAHGLLPDGYPGAELSGPALLRTEGSEAGIDEFHLIALDAGNEPLSADARLAAWPSWKERARRDIDLVADARSGVAELRWIAQGHAGPPLELPTRALVERVVAAALLAPEPSGGLLAALLVPSPPRLVAARIAGGSVIDEPVEIELGGEPWSSANATGALLAVADDRLLVATGASVIAFRAPPAEEGQSEMTSAPLERDPDFAGHVLDGPLAGPVPLNR